MPERVIGGTGSSGSSTFLGDDEPEEQTDTSTTSGSTSGPGGTGGTIERPTTGAVGGGGETSVDEPIDVVEPADVGGGPAGGGPEISIGGGGPERSIGMPGMEPGGEVMPTGPTPPTGDTGGGAPAPPGDRGSPLPPTLGGGPTPTAGAGTGRTQLPGAASTTGGAVFNPNAPEGSSGISRRVAARNFGISESQLEAILDQLSDQVGRRVPLSALERAPDGSFTVDENFRRFLAAEAIEDQLAARDVDIDLRSEDVQPSVGGRFELTDEALAEVRARSGDPNMTLGDTPTPGAVARAEATTAEGDVFSTRTFGTAQAPPVDRTGEAVQEGDDGAIDLLLDIGFQRPEDDRVQLTGPGVDVSNVLGGGEILPGGDPGTLNTEVTDRLTRGRGLFGAERQAELEQVARERQELFGIGEESEEFVTGLTGSEEAGAFAGGLGKLPGQFAALPQSLFLAGDVATETAVNLPGAVREFGAAETGTAILETGGRATEGLIRSAEEDPFGFAGQLTGELALGIGGARALERAPGAVRSASIRARGGRVFDIEELSDPPRETGGGLPGFSRAAMADPEVARTEFAEQARRNLLGGDEPVAFHGRAAEDVAEFGRFGRVFEAPAGTSEIPGLFQSADLSPLRLGGGAGGLLSMPSLRLPRPRLRTASVAAERGVDVDVMDPVRGFDEAAEFMQRADPNKSFIRAGRVGPTGEQEAIAPPGALFESTGEIFGVRAGGDVVPGRVFQRGAAEAAGEAGEVGLTQAQMARFGSEGLSEVSDLAQRRGTPFFPTFGFAPSAAGFEAPDVADTTPAARRTEPTVTTAPTATTPVTSLFGISAAAPMAMTTAPATAPTTGVTSLFGGTTTAPTTPPSEPTAPTTPPTTAPTTPPSEPSVPPTTPSVPPTVFGSTGPPSPPTRPPTGPPGPTGTPFTPVPPGTSPFGPPGPPMDPDEPRDRDERRRFPLLPTGTEFVNPIASGAEFLFGGSLLGGQADVQDGAGEQTGADIAALFGGPIGGR